MSDAAARDQGREAVAAGEAGVVAPRRGHETLALELRGELPCVGCGYTLRGLSIRSACPECGTSVRATILAAVDPAAAEIRPLDFPRLTAAGLLLCTWAGLASALCVWALRGAEVVRVWLKVDVGLAWAGRASVLLLAASGVGAVALIRPHRGVKRMEAAAGAAAVACFVPLVGLHAHTLLVTDATTGGGSVFFGAGGLSAARSLLRLGSGLLMALIVLGLSERISDLVNRSVVLRTGRVETQPHGALLAALCVAACGDAVNLLVPRLGDLAGDLLSSLEVVLVALGSFLFTIGLLGMAVDARRVTGTLVRRGASLADALGGGPGAAP